MNYNIFLMIKQFIFVNVSDKLLLVFWVRSTKKDGNTRGIYGLHKVLRLKERNYE